MTFHPNELRTHEMAQGSTKSGWPPSLCFHGSRTHYIGSGGVERDYTFTPREGINNMHSIFAVWDGIRLVVGGYVTCVRWCVWGVMRG